MELEMDIADNHCVCVCVCLQIHVQILFRTKLRRGFSFASWGGVTFIFALKSHQRDTCMGYLGFQRVVN